MPGNSAKIPVRLGANVSVQIKKEHPDDEPIFINFSQAMPVVVDRTGSFIVRVDVDGQVIQVPLKTSRFVGLSLAILSLASTPGSTLVILG
jgi:hypothetical protein